MVPKIFQILPVSANERRLKKLWLFGLKRKVSFNVSSLSLCGTTILSLLLFQSLSNADHSFNYTLSLSAIRAYAF